MTHADMLTVMKTWADENSLVSPFYDQDQNYYDALNQAQNLYLVEAVGGKETNWKAVRNLVVNDILNDGGTLTQRCFKPLMVTDATNKNTGKIADVAQYRGYSDITQAHFLQAEVDNQTLRTIPSGQTGITIYYLRYPLDISASQDCEFSPVVHPQIVAVAFEIMIHKDIDAPYTEMIETERNKTELLKEKGGGEVAPIIPYQQQK